jgi:hypothetical protein
VKRKTVLVVTSNYRWFEVWTRKQREIEPETKFVRLQDIAHGRGRDRNTPVVIDSNMSFLYPPDFIQFVQSRFHHIYDVEGYLAEREAAARETK